MGQRTRRPELTYRNDQEPRSHQRNVATPVQGAGARTVETSEGNAHPFIVRIWLEETTLVSGHAKWRGHITHVPSGNRQYFESLDEINTFIRPYLEGIGVKSGISWKIRRWVQRIKAVLFSNI